MTIDQHTSQSEFISELSGKNGIGVSVVRPMRLVVVLRFVKEREELRLVIERLKQDQNSSFHSHSHSHLEYWLTISSLHLNSSPEQSQFLRSSTLTED